MTNERAPVTAGEVMQLAVQFSDACFRANNHHGHDQSEYLALRVAVSALVAERDAMKAALNVIASWNEGDEVGSGFDEPWSAKTARAALEGKP